jgi:hypothetical protein
VATDLLFQQAPITAPPVDLVFGETGGAADVEVTLEADFGALQFDAQVVPRVDLTLEATFAALEFVGTAEYLSNTQRPTVGRTITAWELAVGADASSDVVYTDSAKLHVSGQGSWQLAASAQAFIKNELPGTFQRQRSSAQTTFQDGAGVGPVQVVHPYSDMLRDRRQQRHSRFQDATPAGTGDIRTGYQERLRDRRPGLANRFTEALPLRRLHASRHQIAARSASSRRGRYQEAIVPPPGTSVIPVGPPVPPDFDPCYLPPEADAVDLLFSGGYVPGTALFYICERHTEPPPGGNVIVPIRSVYVVLNNVTLRRVIGNIQLPTLSLSLSIDADSWTWGFNASLPGSSLIDVQPDENGPVELEASINGTLYRLLAEKISRERTFNNSTIRVSGRGKSALLADPYSPVQSFGNPSQARTAQQLMNDVLTFNGVPIGWDIDWQIDDWLVPTAAFNARGTYMEGLMTVAGAVNAYIQPHPTSQILRVLPRYLLAPWDWGLITPDFVLPSAVTTQEGIDWIEKPLYNRVFVSGTSQGVLGQVTKTGTAGDLLAPMATDALITQAAAARQRGMSILADTGKQAHVRLRLPVLPETGVISPGKFVRYEDGSEVLFGVVRSTSLESSLPELWQTISVETHYD